MRLVRSNERIIPNEFAKALAEETKLRRSVSSFSSGKVKTMMKIFIFISLFYPIALFGQSDSVVLQHIEDVPIHAKGSMLLNPTSVCASDNNFVWIDKHSVKLLDKNGSVVNELEVSGKGPGEVNNADDVFCHTNHLFIFDNSLKKIVEYLIERNRLRYLDEQHFKVSNNRNFTFRDNNFFFLISHTLNPEASSIEQFDNEGNKIFSYGNIPDAAALSRSLAGNGIDYLNNQIYFSYLGDPVLYKINLENQEFLKLEDVPEYFTKADAKKLEGIKTSMRDLIFYAYEISRVKDLFIHQDYIIQLVEDGGPRMEKEMTYYLEVWQNDIKAGSAIPIESLYTFSDGEFIYSLTGNEEERFLKKYKLQ